MCCGAVEGGHAGLGPSEPSRRAAGARCPQERRAGVHFSTWSAAPATRRTARRRPAAACSRRAASSSSVRRGCARARRTWVGVAPGPRRLRRGGGATRVVARGEQRDRSEAARVQGGDGAPHLEAQPVVPVARRAGQRRAVCVPVGPLDVGRVAVLHPPPLQVVPIEDAVKHIEVYSHQLPSNPLVATKMAFL